ncbi:MAG: amidohydrolase [Parvularculaceae bacterium]|nr:amidohydrolase [Parvularculaceae bacterium]
MKSRALFALSMILVGAPFASAGAQDELRAEINADYKANLATLFDYFHRNPELSRREFNTSERLGAEIRALGFDVTQKVGGTGVVAVMRNGAGPTIMIRADMDGLPVKEASGLSYASLATQEDIDGEVKPVMHACGHDTHMTALVGAARALAARKDQWKGTLVLIGQPAEERISGARAMMEDGLYKRFPKPDYALAFHVSASHPSGKIEVPLVAGSSSDSVDIIVHGVGAHGAAPNKGVDPVLVASQIVVSLQSIVSRSIEPLQPGVITVGAIHGGSKHNIIGDKVHMQLTVRSNDPDVRLQLLDGIDRVAEGVAVSMGVPKNLMPEVIRSPSETTPPTVNDAATVEIFKKTFTEHFGADKLIDMKPEGMGAEDFAYFVTPESGVKGLYFVVGGTPEKDLKTAPSHHSPFFKVEPEPAIKSATEAMVVGAMRLFNGE